MKSMYFQTINQPKTPAASDSDLLRLTTIHYSLPGILARFLVTIQQHPIYPRSGSPVYRCMTELPAYVHLEHC